MLHLFQFNFLVLKAKLYVFNEYDTECKQFFLLVIKENVTVTCH